MDLLDNILNDLDKTSAVRKNAPAVRVVVPPMSEEKKKKQEQEREKLDKWRESIASKIREYVESDEDQPLHFPPLNKPQRLTIHEIVDSNDLVSHTFGDEENKLIIVYKRSNCPSIEMFKLMSEYFVSGMGNEDLDGLFEKVKKGELVTKKVPAASTSSSSIIANHKRNRSQREEEEEETEGDLSHDQGKGKKKVVQQKQQPRGPAVKRLKVNEILGDKVNQLKVLNTVKRDRRTIEQIQEEIQQRKKQKQLLQQQSAQSHLTSPDITPNNNNNNPNTSK